MNVAHIRQIDGLEQSVKAHLVNVSSLTMEYGSKISLKSTGELIGILHDIGKATSIFNSYITYCFLNPKDKSLKGSINHSTAGAKLIYDKFYNQADPYQKLTAQIISMAICSHHGGLIDCLDLVGTDLFTKRMETDKEIYYKEALNYLYKNCLKIEEIHDLFNKSKEEIKLILIKINKVCKTSKFGQFGTGLLLKYLFSCIIDADRYDTYIFMEGKEINESFDKLTLWNNLSCNLEKKLDIYPKSSNIDLLRNEVSDVCKKVAINNTGIYQLSVPTGGGKTLSSLRFALEHAKIHDKDRIFYIIPFTTIIEQNAKEIREVLGNEDVILEHHSNLIIDKGEGDDDIEQENHKILTERWDSPIILTTMVQFLETLFGGGTKSIRRLHNLSNSIIIFDEIQSIPLRCINMFNSAINFLSYICNATVLLCTATQPLLSTTEMPIKLANNPNIAPLEIFNKYEQLKRVNVLDKRITDGYRTDQIRDFILDKMEHVNSMLVVLNTKNIAREIFKVLSEEIEYLPDAKKYLIYHLSTNMCPSHRLEILEGIRKNLGLRRLICVSTQLIEAGVNISFECVIRSLAGLDNIAQAAGRCNRHGEKACREVYIVNIKDENISKLLDIKEAQECTRRVLNEYKENPGIFNNDLLSQNAMNRYYQYYFYNRKNEMNYTLSKPNNDKTMYDILSGNPYATSSFKSNNGFETKLMLKQSFKTAGNEFKAIDQKTVGVIVPYDEEGKKLIILLNGECNLVETKKYLKQAQKYSVNLYDNNIRKLDELGGILKLKNGLVLSIRKEFYNKDFGITYNKQEMEFCNS